jgi:hypothetical protein
MQNPAFGLHDGTDSTGSDGAEDGGGQDGGGYPDDGGDDGGGTGGDGGGDGDDTDWTGDETTWEPEACDYGKTPPLDIVFEDESPNAPPCPASVDGFFHAVEAVDNGWALQPCPGDGCTQCPPGGEAVVELSMWPLSPQELIDLGCLHVRLESLWDDWDGCHYDAATIFRAGDATEMPVIVASSGNYGIPDAAAPTLGGLQFDLEWLWDCPCHEIPDFPECCEEEPPAAYKLWAGDQYAYPGEWVPITLGPAGAGVEYEFHNVQSYDPGICGEDVLVEWALMRP